MPVLIVIPRNSPHFSCGSEFLVVVAFAFHAINGIRLVLVELGWLIGKPRQASSVLPPVQDRTPGGDIPKAPEKTVPQKPE